MLKKNHNIEEIVENLSSDKAKINFIKDLVENNKFDLIEQISKKYLKMYLEKKKYYSEKSDLVKLAIISKKIGLEEKAIELFSKEIKRLVKEDEIKEAKELVKKAKDITNQEAKLEEIAKKIYAEKIEELEKTKDLEKVGKFLFKIGLKEKATNVYNKLIDNYLKKLESSTNKLCETIIITMREICDCFEELFDYQSLDIYLLHKIMMKLSDYLEINLENKRDILHEYLVIAEELNLNERKIKLVEKYVEYNLKLKKFSPFSVLDKMNFEKQEIKKLKDKNVLVAAKFAKSMFKNKDLIKEIKLKAYQKLKNIGGRINPTEFLEEIIDYTEDLHEKLELCEELANLYVERGEFEKAEEFTKEHKLFSLNSEIKKKIIKKCEGNLEYYEKKGTSKLGSAIKLSILNILIYIMEFVDFNYGYYITKNFHSTALSYKIHDLEIEIIAHYRVKAGYLSKAAKNAKIIKEDEKANKLYIESSKYFIKSKDYGDAIRSLKKTTETDSVRDFCLETMKNMAERKEFSCVITLGEIHKQEKEAEKICLDYMNEYEKEERYDRTIEIAKLLGLEHKVKEIANKGMEYYESEGRFYMSKRLAKEAGFEDKVKYYENLEKMTSK